MAPRRISIIMMLGAMACTSSDPPLPVAEGFLQTPEGVGIFYRSVGSGSQTVVVPAGMFLESFLEPLARDRRVVFYDPAGRGRSDRVDTSRVSFDQNVRDLEAVRLALGLERMALIGWSGLGKEVAAYASRYPGRVTRLVQMSPVPPSPDEFPMEEGVRPRAQRIDMAAVTDLERRRDAGEFDGRAADLCRALNHLTLPANFADTTFAARVPDICQYENEWPENINPYFSKIVATQGEQDWRDSIRAVGIMRLVIHGREDPIPIAGGRAWVEGDPNARFLEVSPAGHFPFIEQRDVVLEAIDRFLGGAWPARASP